jgi:hypothetical protein
VGDQIKHTRHNIGSVTSVGTTVLFFELDN